MNFLSHFYFDQDTPNANIIVGTILPDLLKNANKSWNVHPEKHPQLFESPISAKDLLIGWKRHLEVDRLFHTSTFFEQNTSQLKQLLLPILGNSPVRPSFLAHIGVELLLDHLLIEHQKIDIYHFYDTLAKVDMDDLGDFLHKCHIQDTALFFSFFSRFKSSRYLISYQKLENISYALQRICMRLWTHPFTEETLHQLTLQLEFYKKHLEADFIAIFDEIENRLT